MTEPSQRWQALPERIRPEQLVTTQDVDPGQDHKLEIDYERWWATQDGG
ncbi:hypothetical protein [Amycolatopsis anabasis]|nr:hypothetical protein [Amycolatopsis anabasis]